MDDLIKRLVVGTAAQPNAQVETGTDVDGLLAGLSAVDTEQKLLIAAAAGAVYRQAGYSAEKAKERSAASPPDAEPVCSPPLAQLLRRMFDGEHAAFLGEAWQRMAHAGQRLPHELLPLALDKCRQELRPSLMAVLGARGRWLAGFNADWRWACAARIDAVEDGPTDAEAERIWNEGVLTERVAILRRMRRIDPARARLWLADAWSKEKADHRAKLLEAVDVALTAEDEPLLEMARRDRSAGVRSCAVRYLARIPGSALATRILERADAMLSWELPPPVRGIKSAIKALAGGGQASPRLNATPPTAIDAAWEQDGIARKPPQGIGERGWWLAQTLSCVSPQHWEDRFRADPTALLAASEAGEWYASLLEGWAQAAISFASQNWLAALWEALRRYALPRGTSREAQLFPALQDQLLAVLTGDAADRIVVRLLEGSLDEPDRWAKPLAALRRPWSADVTSAWSAALTQRVRSLRPGSDNDWYLWSTLLETAAGAMHPSGFAAAVGPWELATGDGSLSRWQHQLDKFGEAVRARQIIWQETANVHG
ncbi:MAG TPA: DUF5691 domain-containing protein [Pirellulales bacterium]|nr:DUF5691 domain-containing protein [Pirellulales bacterium]